MKERGILFSAPMVRALLTGRKTQTRRAVKLLDDGARHQGVEPDGMHLFTRGCAYGKVRCPYGRAGDRLWVREAWRTVAEADALPPRDLTPAHRIWFEADAPHQPGAGRYRHSQFMPRLASRITLEVTEVRVERLQDISEADAIAEGLTVMRGEALYAAPLLQAHWEQDPRVAYRALWEAINGAGAWEATPWVWAVSFRLLERLDA